MDGNKRHRRRPPMGASLSTRMKLFDRTLDRLVLQPFRETPPTVLYHYTTWSGRLLGGALEGVSC